MAESAAVRLSQIRTKGRKYRMNTTWIRRLYDAGTRLEIRADRFIEVILWGALLKRLGTKGKNRRRRGR